MVAIKYHISKETGRPNRCYAVKGPCPLGESSPHFSTKEEARSHVAAEAKKENNTIPKVLTKKERISAPSSPQRNSATDANENDILVDGVSFVGPKPESIKLSSPAGVVKEQICTHCGCPNHGDEEGYSSCCNEPTTYGDYKKSASYEAVFKNGLDMQRFARNNGLEISRMIYDPKAYHAILEEAPKPNYS